ncbi:GH116 family glycosyl-hydrolase [Paenibacillus montanisoli]|uniref:Glycosyl-hydrolase family 116 catalytic region domain-containing protein n=1 Tax=Paenibacillus montanisoli TaxID=2081970 RepID=A0A328U6S1_9BACL|nr:GH116 family glycosyl-hydrolase [Paenibacillus montanisoli]RAP78548.1 hypothetical protein DL346_09050 [Paenibacillus montanisoli]
MNVGGVNAWLDLKFKHIGNIRRDMEFGYFEQPCYYTESLDRWSTEWAKEPYLYCFQLDGSARNKIDPPIGIRSAVPLGGLGAGTLELRGDGSIKEWNIFNNSPAGGGQKVELNEALFGIRVKDKDKKITTRSVRTSPPEGIPAIEEIQYSGAFPVSRLKLKDSEMPIDVSLFGYCEYHIGDPEASAAPAVIFSFNLNNPSDSDMDVALMFTLPNHIQGRFSRREGLALTKDGDDATSGSMAIHLKGGDDYIFAGSANDLSQLWTEFAANGTISGLNQLDRLGAIGTNITLRRGETRTISFILSWYFPNRMHDIERVGNYYSRLYSSANDVARKVAARIEATVIKILQWQRLVFDNDLPEWLQDAMVNSTAAIYKTGMWFEDKRWRQWESFSCPNVSPIHIDLYRSLPYIMFFPSLLKSMIRGYAEFQWEDGYIQEDLGTNKSTKPTNFRPMGDCNPAFILLMYQQYLWLGDKDFIDELWPNIRKAALWQVRRCEPFGLPHHLLNTYDWWEFDHKDTVSYNAVLHLATIKAVQKLAEIHGDKELETICQENSVSSQQQFYEKFWTGDYFRSWWMNKENYPDALHSDTLYGQLWSFLLGLGPVLDSEKMKSHLNWEMKKNNSEFGLKVMQGDGRDNDSYPDPMPELIGSNGPRDNLVWEAASLDWSALNLYLGTDKEICLAEAEKIVLKWRDKLRDLWDIKDLSTGWNGYPWCNSHYSRQLILWSIPMALIDQQYSKPDKSLSVKPKMAVPVKLPFFTPDACGIIEITEEVTYIITVLSGTLDLNKLCVGDKVIDQTLSLKAGESKMIK